MGKANFRNVKFHRNYLLPMVIKKTGKCINEKKKKQFGELMAL